MNRQQVTKEAYVFKEYCYEERWASYHEQLQAVLEHSPQSVLEIGVGDGVFGHYIKDVAGIAYTSLDIADDVVPDYVGSVTALPFGDNSFDSVCAFEVLEHLPFNQFEVALSEISRVARRQVHISLPHFGPMLSFSFKIPFLPRVQFSLKIPFPKRHVFNRQHYWEVGKRGYPSRKIRSVCERYARKVSDYIPFRTPYHHFFLLEK